MKSNRAGVFIKGGNLDTQRQEEHRVPMKAGSRVMGLQAKEHGRFPAATSSSGSSMGQTPPHSLRENQPGQHLQLSLLTPSEL